MKLFSRHISFARLVDLAEGRLPADQRAALQDHVAVCPRCGANKGWIEHAIDLMRTDDSKDAPAEVIARAKRLFRRPVTLDVPTIEQRIVALLRFDSMRQRLSYGVRDGVQAEPMAERQLLFEAGDHNLVIHIMPSGALWTIAGQMLGPQEQGQVELRGPTGVLQTTLNELSEFTLPPVPSGSYELILHLASRDVTIPRLEVGA